MAENLTARINISLVKSLSPNTTVRDTDVNGFGVRRQKGKPSYFLQTRVKGRLRWITIGRHGAPWTPKTARDEAMRLLREISGGVDPSAERQRQRRMPTVQDAAHQFLEEHGPKLKPQTLTDYRRLVVQRIVPGLGKLKVDELIKADVSRFHSKLSDTPRMANLCLSVLSKLLSWAEEQGWRANASNPCRGIKKFREARRERFLSQAEFLRLGDALAEAERNNSEMPSAIAAIRLLILTGARLQEILTLQWKYIDFERRLILLPDSKTGAKPIVLSNAAIAVLNDIDRVSGNPHVIVGRKDGACLVNLQKPWRAIRKTAGLDDVRLHDLRHSFASMAAASGASLPMIGKLLGHTQSQTTQRYAHLADDPLHQLNDEVGGAIAEAMAGDRGAAPKEPKA